MFLFRSIIGIKMYYLPQQTLIQDERESYLNSRLYFQVSSNRTMLNYWVKREVKRD